MLVKERDGYSLSVLEIPLEKIPGVQKSPFSSQMMATMWFLPLLLLLSMSNNPELLELNSQKHLHSWNPNQYAVFSCTGVAVRMLPYQACIWEGNHRVSQPCMETMEDSHLFCHLASLSGLHQAEHPYRRVQSPTF